MDHKECHCNGTHAECMYCGGTGKINSNEVEIIPIVSSEKEKLKEAKELDDYLHKKSEKLYVSENTSELGQAERLKFNRKKKAKLAKKKKLKEERKKKKNTILVLDKTKS